MSDSYCLGFVPEILVNNCFERISIGEQLPFDAIYRNISELTTKECEQICKQDKQCQSYDYGVGAKGNATCNLSTLSEKEIKDKSLLHRHPDYDVYVRRFQCEQSPPTPIQAEFDDPDGLLHRPTLKPNNDPKKPLSDELPDDLESYGNSKPDIKPSYNNERPDEYVNSKPDYDNSPSYGVHKPQDIPYAPQKPQNNLVNTKPDPYDVLQLQNPYERPNSQGSWRPQEMYGHRPTRPNYGLDLYRPEMPQYQYVIRPNRKPYQQFSRPDFDVGYQNKPDYPSKPDPYGQNNFNHPSDPIIPSKRPFKPSKPSGYPTKPYDEPNNSYNSQYASNYGNQYQDNSIYLEIKDPPRPYKPLYDSNRPNYGINQGNYDYGHLGYGYDTYSNQNSLSHLQSSQSQYYDSGTVLHGSNYRPNQGPAHEPSKPYTDNQSSIYGQSAYNSNNVLRPQSTRKPLNSNKKPSYESSYSSEGITDGYGISSQGYGTNDNYLSNSHAHAGNDNYESSSQSNYGNKPNSNKKPHNNNHAYASSSDGYYGENDQLSINKPYGGNQGYGVSNQNYHNEAQVSYGPNNKPYNNHQGHDSQSINKPYGSSQVLGGSDQSYLGNNYASYGSLNKPYGSNHEYGSSNHNKPSYDGGSQTSVDKPYVSGSGYGSGNQNYYGSYDENTQSSSNKPYGGNQGYGGTSQSNHGSYGSDNKLQGSTSIYGNNNKKPNGVSSYKPYEDGYENSSGYNSNSATYGNIYSSSNKPYESSQGYGGQTSDSNNSDSYGSSQIKKKPYGGTHGHNGNSGYGSNHASYDNDSSEYDSAASYGDQTHSPGYNSGPSYSGNRPISSQSSYNNQQNLQNSFESSYNKPTGSVGYQKPGNQASYSPGYDPDRPDVKPVYEYEIDRPGDVPSYIARPNGDVITSRPVAVGDYGEKPGYRRNTGEEISYKACFRRVLAGRRTLRSYVRRVVNCERLEDCQRECATEQRFHCESFNYRLDPTFRGKGLCELMTKPIEAFDLRRDFVEDKDYDFYELDRNSLEPNCPETLRGPGLLHSGFLSSKRPLETVDRWKDRIDWYDKSSKSDYERYNNERRTLINSSRKYNNQVFVPYQIGISRSNDSPEPLSQYGGSYGGDNYYKDKTNYRKSINHWQIADEVLRANYYGVKSHGLNTDFNYHSLGKSSESEDGHGYGYGAWKRGRWNSSWNGLDYEESGHYKHSKPPHLYYKSEDRIDETSIKDCSSRRRPGMALGSGAIRRSLFARNVVDCEAACFGEKEFKCVSYSYRYSSSGGSDNCFLSERPYRGLDMSADSDSDVYAMPQDQGCSTISRKPWIESECFWHVRSDAAVEGSAARASLTVTGLGACEAECIRAHAFFCRGFSFRFDSPTIGDDLENCILTSSPPTSLEVGRGLRSTIGHELYARGNYGRGCEPALYDDAQHREAECYLQYDMAAKLKGSAVRGQARVKDEQECGRACTDAPFRCLSFSFNNHAHPEADNCLLSEIRLFDLQRGVDYEQSTDDWLFAFDLFNGQCWRKVNRKQHYDAPSYELPRPLPPSVLEYPVSGPSGTDLVDPPDLPYPSALGPSGPGFKPGYPTGPEPPEHKPSYNPPTGPGFKPSYSPGHLADTAYPGPSGLDYKPGYRPSSSSYLEPSIPDYPPPPPFKPTIAKPPAYVPSPPSGSDYIPGYVPTSPSVSGYKPGYVLIEYDRPHLPPSPKPVSRPGQNRPSYQGDREENGPTIVSWRHYTVSGYPCRRGTTCAQNHVAGHWACELEGGEIGSWDYCCAPEHRCGYSEGFQKPWCYVGPSHEQWRPCSEKYYPYYKHKVPHPSQGRREVNVPRPTGQWRDKPANIPIEREKLPGPYLPEADKTYWDNLYKNGPQAYYDSLGNPLPGYTRVPTEERPRIKYRHNPANPGSGTWVPVPELDSHNNHLVPGPLGVPRYWPVAYLHKEPPPNMTYFRYNETDNASYDKIQSRENEDSVVLSTERVTSESKKVDVIKPKFTDIEGRNIRHKPIENNTNNEENILHLDTGALTNTTTTTTTTTSTTTTTTSIPTTEINHLSNVSDTFKDMSKGNITETELQNPENVQIIEDFENIKGIDGKLEDFSKSIEVFNLEDESKCDKMHNIKALEEERQIEAIGRLLASRRGGKLILEKYSQKDLENEHIAVGKDLLEFNFGNKFPTTERRGIVQRVSKEDIAKEIFSNDKSLEVSETTFIRPPRVLSTTENIRKAIVNGKVFYDAMIREQTDLLSNLTRKAKNLKLEETKGPSVVLNNTFSKRKILQPRNVNPVRKVRRIYRKRYNPDEVRKRLLEREKSLKQSTNTTTNNS
ncbi:unnamed protein product [Parnassius apollo]|uniref:(apollo) hypothetical protein n=1 Tax=Parnassius apollo TaxID=110799 RepID=A0A8S3WGT3_PARAO|nr:unnamed protein product [Parnassius apollo]